MPRISSSRSESSEVELDGLEHEFLRLQQEYRIMEGDRKAYSEESQYIIRKQRETIAALQSENEELLKDNRLAGSQQNQTNDTRNVDKLNDLLGKEAEYKKQVKSMKEEIANFDHAIHQTEKKISQQRKSMGGVHMSQAKYVALQKHIRVLENRLDKANGKFNQGLARNSSLRDEIDHMRTERTIFQGLNDKLQRRVHDNKEEIAKVIEASTAAYDSRDDAQNKMIALKEKADKELLQYNTELKELMRIIDHDRKLRDFMNIKSEDRIELHGLSSNYRCKKDELKEKGGEKEEAINSYEVAFEQIKDATGLEDLSQLVDKFIETEDRNFALFNYVNELNNDIEMVQEQIHETEIEIKKFHEESLDLDEKRKAIVSNMENESNEAMSKAAKHEERATSNEKILTQLKEGIQSLFGKINCDASSIEDMLGGHQNLKENNLMHFLGIIEQRTNELIQVEAFVASKDGETPERPAVALLGKGPLPIPASVNLHPPATAEDYESDFSLPSDDENRPLTQQELRNRIVRGISKRETSKVSKEKSHHQHPITGDLDFDEPRVNTSTKKSTKTTRSPIKEK